MLLGEKAHDDALDAPHLRGLILPPTSARVLRKVLWQAKLPAGGQATPMTYSVGGRQYVVIAAGGYKDSSTRGGTT